MPPRTRPGTAADPVRHHDTCDTKQRTLDEGVSTLADGTSYVVRCCTSCGAASFDPPLPPVCKAKGCDQRGVDGGGLCAFHVGFAANKHNFAVQ